MDGGDEGLRIAQGRMLVGGKSTDLVSGEVHYWRLNPIFWKDVLEAVKDAGLRMVSTYVPYVYHEIEPGIFDFHGKTHPSRNLVGFLRMCSEAGFKVLIRPGPVIMAEWRNMGLPDHIAADPELRVSTGFYRFQRRFEEKLEGYFKGLCDAICPLQFPAGPIVAWQIDNELGGAGPVAEELQIGVEAEIYREFLRTRFASVDEMNQAYGTSYKSLEEVSYPASPGALARRQALDMFAYSGHFIAKVVDTYRQKLARHGVTVPFYLNFTVSPSRDWAAAESHVDFMGVDIYLHDLIPWEEHLFFSRTIKYLAAVAKIPWSPEFQSGIWPHLHDRHGRGVSSRHIRYMTLAAVATGLKGLNYYMLVNRDNWFLAPIDEVGTPPGVGYPEKRQSLSELKRALELIGKNDLLSCDRQTRVALLWYRPHYQLEALEKKVSVPEGLSYEELEKPCRFDYEEFWGLYRALSEADIDFDVVDLLRTEPGKLARYEAVLYGGKREMDSGTQELLAGYARTGGRLIVCGHPPQEDFSGVRCRTLALALEGSRATRQVRSPPDVVRELEGSGVDLGPRSGVPGVLTYLHAGSGRKLLYVVNTLANEQALSIRLLDGARDLDTGESVRGTSVRVEGKDVKVFLCETLS